MLHDLIVLWFGWVRDGGYLGIAGLMALESSIVPVPSEVVIPPAAYWAAQGKLNLWGVIAAGTIGSWVGAAATYWASASLGRALVARWGRYVMVTPEKLERAEAFLHRYEAGGVFFSRLLPVIRHLIGIPCGLVRMNFATFSLMTVVGSAIWCSVLAWYGQRMGTAHPGAIDDPQAMVAALKGDLHGIILAIVALACLYAAALWATRPRRKEAAPPASGAAS